MVFDQDRQYYCVGGEKSCNISSKIKLYIYINCIFSVI